MLRSLLIAFFLVWSTWLNGQAAFAQVSPPGSKPDAQAPALSAEELYWREVRAKNTIPAFELYLSEYPSGRFVDDARRAIKDLEIAAERKIWESAVQSGSKEQLVAYVSTYPNGSFVSQAKLKIRALEKVEEAAKWREAEEQRNPEGQKSADAFKKYLATYPRSEYASLARLRLIDMGVDPAGTVTKTPLGFELVWVPPGSFMMGSPENEFGRYDSEGPQRKVTIGQGFWMGRFEVTQAQWQLVMNSNPSDFKDCGPDCPVGGVTWEETIEFVKKLNERDDGFTYALPSEAMWEYAARAGTTTPFSYGGSLTSTQANFDGDEPYGGGRKGPDLGKIVKVGLYQPNQWGLYDMHGNMGEWVYDLYSNGYSGLPTDGSANGGTYEYGARVWRGGSYYNDANSARSAVRLKGEKSSRFKNIGLRIMAKPRP